MTIPSPLPPFEGRPVKGSDMSITGKVLTPTARVLHLGDEVALLVVGTVSKVSHADTDAGLIRTHTVKLSEGHVVPEGDLGMLMDARSRDTELLDQLLGRASLFGDVDPETGEIE